MTVIYIRHANDGVDRPQYTHDPGVTPESRTPIRELVKRLIATYGNPDLIFISPMNRTISTYALMKPYLQKPRVIIDRHLSRYFTSEETETFNLKDLHPRTLYLGLPLSESNSGFKERLEEHIREFSRRGFYQSRRPVVWCLTHALVMKKIALNLELPLKDHLDFLEVLPVESCRRKESSSVKLKATLVHPRRKN